MRGRPECKLDPRIKTVWRISDVIVLTIFCLRWLSGGNRLVR